MRMFDPPLEAGRPRVVTPLRPTEDDPQPVVMRPGWVWWYGTDGHPRARSADGRTASAGNFAALTETIRKRERGGK